MAIVLQVATLEGIDSGDSKDETQNQGENSSLASHTKVGCTFIDKFHDNSLKPIIIWVNQFARNFQEDKNGKVDNKDHTVVAGQEEYEAGNAEPSIGTKTLNQEGNQKLRPKICWQSPHLTP